uniref:Uncharacterized protein n=1 Tax=Oryza rufipogon TaxID=4529 RepID=A0A0E0QZ80_ORYRU
MDAPPPPSPRVPGQLFQSPPSPLLPRSSDSFRHEFLLFYQQQVLCAKHRARSKQDADPAPSMAVSEELINPDIRCMARRAKLTIYLKPKEIHDKCGTINTCKIDTKLQGGEDCIYQGLFYNLHNIQSSLPKNDRSAKSSLRPFCNILKKSDGTVGMPILRSRRVPPSEMMVIGDEGDP